VAQLYPQPLGSLFIASYDSNGYGGGILTRLPTVVPLLGIVAEKCLPSSCLAIDVSSDSIIPSL
jgi:hypothetical protein